MYNCFKSQNISKLNIYDVTETLLQNSGKIFMVNGHINKTGNNILINNQNILNIDFIDLKELYTQNKKGIITTCCGKKLNSKYQYPTHYLCNISILARAMKIKTINAFLYNK